MLIFLEKAQKAQRGQPQPKRRWTAQWRAPKQRLDLTPALSSIRLRRAYGGQGRGRTIRRLGEKPATALVGQRPFNRWRTIAIPSPIRWERARVRASINPQQILAKWRDAAGVQCNA